MNPPVNGVTEFPVDARESTPATISETRPMYWSVRRELWENRSIWMAPLAISVLVLFGFLLSTFTLPSRVRAMAPDAAKQRAVVSTPFDAAAGVPMAVAFIVGVFYCFDALYGERRDRSILFWKSLPVSDRTTVLSKAAIPLVVMPLIIFAIVVASHTVILVFSSMVLAISGLNATALLGDVKLVQRQFAFLYGLIAVALWHAPIYAWMLLVSAWARRAVFLWAVLPIASIAAMETIMFGSSHFASFLGYRVVGWFGVAFRAPEKSGAHSVNPLSEITPANFLTTPGLWIGLAFAAAFLTAAIRLRRNREPI